MSDPLKLIQAALDAGLSREESVAGAISIIMSEGIEKAAGCDSASIEIACFATHYDTLSITFTKTTTKEQAQRMSHRERFEDRRANR